MVRIKSVEFNKAFKYPFNRFAGMLNILWLFLPVAGWLALAGYGVRIADGFISGKFEELPKFRLWGDMILGLKMIVKSLPFFIPYLVLLAIIGLMNRSIASVLSFAVGILVIPMMGMNFIRKKTVASYFEFDLVKRVFDDFSDYLLAVMKTLGLLAVFGVLSLVLIGIPAGIFTQHIFIADFYRRHAKP